MAITVQLAAADTLAGGGHSATSSSRNVTLGAGTNRALLVASALEAASANASVVTGVTYGGVALSKVTDGELTADLNTLAGSDDVANLVWWILLEEDLPANGSNALAATVDAGRQHGLAWFILEGVDQENPVIDVAMAFNSNAQSITATLSDADPDGLCLFTAYKNNTGVSNAVDTIDGSAGTALSDDQNQGGAHVRFVRGVGSGSSACTFSHSSGNARIGIVAIALRPAATTQTHQVGTAAFTAGSASMAATATIVQDFETIEPIGSPDQGLTNPRNLTVPDDCDLVLVTIYGDFISPRTGTLGGQALSVGYNDDTLGDDNSQWVQFLYMLEPPTGTQQLSLTGEGGGDHNFFVTYWRGVGSFDSAAIANAANISRTSTENGALLIAGIQDGNSAASSPATGNTELLDDANGSHFYYRVEPVAGTYTVGASAVGGDPDLVSVIFNPKAAAGGADAEIDVAAFTAGSATMAATAQVQRQVSAAAFVAGAPTVAAEAQVQRQVSAAGFAAGAATVATSATRVREVAAAFAADAPTVAAEAQVQRQVSAAAFVSGAATFSARAGQGVKPIGVAAFSATSATMAVTAVVHVHHEVSAAFAASAATMATSAARARSAVAAFAAGAATFAAEGTVTRHLTATFSASSATMAVTVFNPNIVIPRPVTGSASVSEPFGYVRARHPSGSASVSQPRGRVK